MTDDSYNSYDEPKVCNHYNYKLEGDEWTLREDSFRDKNLITTPGWIVKDMLDLLPDSVWNTETTFLIPCIKSGNFAIEVKNRLMKCQDALKKFPDHDDRRNHIDSKQLFCIYWYTEEEFNKNLISGHIWGVNGFLEALYSPSVNFMCTNDLNFDTFKDKTGKKQEKLLESIKEKFGTVKFDVVIGNPPYNNDLYIDFVTWGHQRANKYSLWITPAKWQAKGGDKNERFRQQIVPHMSKIVYYPDETEIFNISCQGGITYFNTDRNNINYDSKNVRVINKGNITLEYSGRIRQMIDLSDIENNILDKIFEKALLLDNKTVFRPCKNYFISVDADDQAFLNWIDPCGKYIYKDAKQEINITDCGINHLCDIEKYKLLISGWGSATPYFKAELYKPYEICGRKYTNVFVGSLDECKSAYSFYSTKLVWWSVYRFFRTSKLNDDSWRFVPDPGKFDHIFTDQELYKKYNLTDEEIHIIESVIKDRK